MKDIILAVITKLKADTAVAAVVSTHVYRKKLPNKPEFPAITVDRVDKVRDDDTNTGRRAHARVQCTTWSTTIGQEENLAELVADCLHRTQNTLLTAGTNRVYVISVKDAGGVPADTPDISLYGENRDFMIHYSYR